jgi:type IV pilus assembly protein PilF
MTPATETVSVIEQPTGEDTSTISSSIPKDNAEVADEVPKVLNGIENDTELALKNALDKTDPLLQSELAAPKIDADAETMNETEQVLESSELEVADVSLEEPTSISTPFHIVKPKENLYRISLKYNVKIKKLLEWNKLKDESSVLIGTKLWVRDPNLNE